MVIPQLEKIINFGEFSKKNWHYITAGSIFTIVSLRLLKSNWKDARKAIDPYGLINKKDKEKQLVNMIFLKRLFLLIRIVVPKINSLEGRSVIVFSLFLIARTYLSMKISDSNGQVVRSIVSFRKNDFIHNLYKLALLTIPASIVNSMLKFLLNKLSFSFRSRLFNHFNKFYFSPKICYKLINVDGRMTNPDQILTITLVEWSRELSVLFSNIVKPLFDIFLFSKRLTELLGKEGPILAFIYYFLSSIAFKLLSPMFGKLIARSIYLEGEYKKAHSKLSKYSEEIAFYSGEKKEKWTLKNLFKKIEYHNSFVIDRDYYVSLANGFISKYGSFITAYTVLGIPVFKKNEILKEKNESFSDRSNIVGEYIRNSNLYINLSLAIGKIVVSYNSLQKLAGYTKLITDLEDVFTDLNKGKFVRNDFMEKIEMKEFSNERLKRIKMNLIRFENISITTPNGENLIKNLNLEIKLGINYLVIGPNGCGKSSIFRVLGGLWPIYCGKIFKPIDLNIFYIPQKPYLIYGSLRDQIIYPHSKNEFLKISDDKELLKITKIVKIDFLLEKQKNGFDEKKSWSEYLSGGEKQQLVLARLLYHKPMFAIMDECTSTVSYDLESIIYKKCKDYGINLITISHRKSLWKYHDKVLKIYSGGRWEINDINK